jgi:hypothetical protein
MQEHTHGIGGFRCRGHFIGSRSGARSGRSPLRDQRDRREETAWNGKTGDLVGAWIAFRVPEDAHVDYVMMSAGFDKNEKEDFFLENHRISNVRIEREGKILREAALDPNVRPMQRLDIGTAGGDFKIVVTGVIPGTKTSWKEITVSELAVFGTPGKNVRAKPGPPLVRVGSLDVRDVAYDDTAGATWAAACKAFVDEDAIASNEANKGLHDDRTPSGDCTDGTHAAGHGSILETAHVTIATTPSGGYDTTFSGDVLALRTASGVKITNIRLSGEETAWFWKVKYALRSESWTGDELVIEVQEHRITDSDGYAPPGHEDELHSEVKTILRTTCEATSATCTTEEL